MKLTLPRFVITKSLASGETGFYWNLPKYWRKQGCAIPNEPLGTDYTHACGTDGEGGRAAICNGLFDEWRQQKAGNAVESLVRWGTIDWLFREYRQSKGYLQRVAIRSRPDYERTMLLLADMVTKKGDRIGSRQIRSITPVSADKIFDLVLKGPRGDRPRQAEKLLGLCRRAWRVVRRLHPECFDRAVPNPWEGVTKLRREKATKPAATREQVYAFAWGAIERGHPEPAAAAIICFEWLQRPENVIGGYIRWTDYRAREAPTAIRIRHHKTGAVVLHPLEEQTARFYPEAEDVLAQLPRRGVSMILNAAGEPFGFLAMAKLVKRLREELDLPATFTLDACRHGGMTELEEAELTDGQGRALSAHRSQQSYEGYAKRTMKRALAATRKRRAHVLANAAGTSIQNASGNSLQNEARDDDAAIA